MVPCKGFWVLVRYADAVLPILGSRCGDEMVLRTSCLWSGSLYAAGMASVCRIGSLYENNSVLFRYQIMVLWQRFSGSWLAEVCELMLQIILNLMTDIFTQKSGASMGKRMGPLYACLSMGFIESEFHESNGIPSSRFKSVTFMAFLVPRQYQRRIYLNTWTSSQILMMP